MRCACCCRGRGAQEAASLVAIRERGSILDLSSEKGTFGIVFVSIDIVSAVHICPAQNAIAGLLSQRYEEHP